MIFRDFSRKKYNEEPVMLMDYFEKVVGTPMDMGHYELVIRSFDEKYLLLEELVKAEGSDNETKKTYKVPYNLKNEIMKIVEDEKMDKWNERNDMHGIVGKLYVFKYLQKDTYIRDSSEHMPENGVKVFNCIKSIISKYLSDEYELTF